MRPDFPVVPRFGSTAAIRAPSTMILTLRRTPPRPSRTRSAWIVVRSWPVAGLSAAPTNQMARTQVQFPRHRSFICLSSRLSVSQTVGPGCSSATLTTDTSEPRLAASVRPDLLALPTIELAAPDRPLGVAQPLLLLGGP